MLDLEKLFEEVIVAEGEQPAEDSQGAEGDASTGTEGGQDVAATAQTEPQTTTEYEIDGEKLTLDQIREYRNGYLRQSDYTRKTQEISQARKEHQEALEVYNFLKSNPDIAKQLAELTPGQNVAQKVDPVMKRLEEVEVNFKVQEIQRELESIVSKDKDITDMELLDIANKENVTVTKAYELWKGRNFDKILDKRLKEQSKNLTEQIQKNNGVTKTLISSGDKSNVSANHGLSDTELLMADKLGMSPEEYAKWK